MKALGLLLALAAASGAQAENVDLADWASRLPRRFSVQGVKVEPTYEEAIEIRRQDDLFVVTGGAPAWSERVSESVALGDDGEIRPAPCAGKPCPPSRPPAGFLATASLLAAYAKGRLRGRAEVLAYGSRHVICVAADRLGVENPILDPCFDRATGAVLAQRHRLSGGFEGASLEPTSLRVQ